MNAPQSVLGAVDGERGGGLGRLGAARAQVRQLERERDRGERGQDRDDERAGEPEDQHRGRDQQRREREAGVAADARTGSSRPAARARRVVGVARALGVEGGDAEAADADERAP